MSLRLTFQSFWRNSAGTIGLFRVGIADREAAAAGQAVKQSGEALAHRRRRRVVERTPSPGGIEVEVARTSSQG